MFDLGIDKMIVVAVLVGVIMGPERLRELRRSLPRHIGRIHALYQQGRAQVVDELDELAPDWREYDPRQLHPRRILQDLNAAAGSSPPASPGEMRSSSASGESTDRPGTSEETAWPMRPSSVAPETTRGRGDEADRVDLDGAATEAIPAVHPTGHSAVDPSQGGGGASGGR